MKYLKKFERNIDEFEVGDFVWVKKDNIKPEMEIINKKDWYDNEKTYIARGYNNKYNEFREILIFKEQIERKLTPEEVEKFKIEMDSQKYNL